MIVCCKRNTQKKPTVEKMSAIAKLDSLITTIDKDKTDQQPSADIQPDYLNTLLSTCDNYELNTNITTHTKLNQALITRASTITNSCNNQVYSFEVKDNACKPITNQQSTGTCWLYATLNVLRQHFIKTYNLKSFQFSVEYLYFWHKYELTNFWLESIISTIEQPLDSRLVQYLLSKGCEDGSQFDSALNLIEKYGVIPAICNNNELFGINNEVQCKKRSYSMNRILNRKLREYAMILRKTWNENKDISELREIKKKFMNEIYRILVINFGKPVDKFNWCYDGKNANNESGFHGVKNIKPIDFYNNFVKPCYDLNNLISLVHDPRNEYYRLLTVDYYGVDVIDGNRKRIEYINVPINILKEYTLKMLKKDKVLWFACDIGWYYYPDLGTLDCKQFDFKNALGVDQIGMNKQERLEYGASCNSHSMVLVGVDEEKGDGGGCRKWKIENSWGDKKGNKGYVMMTDEWFDEFVYQVIVEKDMLDKDIVSNAWKDDVIVLPRWDPFAQ